MSRSLFASIFFDVFSEFEIVLWRIFEQFSGWITSVKAAVRLRVAPTVRQEIPGWSAHAVNDRRLGGAACHGNLLGPSCPALVG